jgi:hypothetical protein
MAAMKDMEYICFLVVPLYIDSSSVRYAYGPNYYLSRCYDLSTSVAPIKGSVTQCQSYNTYKGGFGLLVKERH